MSPCPASAVDRPDRRRTKGSREVRWDLPHRRRTFPGVRRRVRIPGGRIALPRQASRGTRVLARREITGEIGPGCRKWRRNIARRHLVFRRAHPVSCIPDRYSSPTRPVVPAQAVGVRRKPVAAPAGGRSVAGIRGRGGTGYPGGEAPDRRTAPEESTVAERVAPPGGAASLPVAYGPAVRPLARQ